MKSKYFLPIFFIQVLIFFSCSNQISNHQFRKTFLKKIIFRTGLCFGTCPLTAGYIDDSLNFYFYGGKYAERDSLPVGYYKGRIIDTLWLETNNKAIALNKYFDSSWEINVDGSAIEINFIDSFNTNRKISGDDMMPDSVYLFVRWLQKLPKKLQLEKITDSAFLKATDIKIEVMRLAPPPPLEKIKFTPPKKKKS
jgi:hypothetical protein